MVSTLLKLVVLFITVLHTNAQAEVSEEHQVIDLQELLRNVSASHTKFVDEFQKLKKETLAIIKEESSSHASECSTQTKLIQDLTTKIDELSNRVTCNNLFKEHARDCADLMLAGKNASGVYRIYPIQHNQTGFDVYCDMETSGGGWTVFQRRGNFGNPDDYFFKNWAQYKNGFGDFNKEFWLGNDKLSVLSKQFWDSPKSYDLRVDLGDELGNKAYAEYNNFTVEDEAEKYKIQFSGYSGTAGDSLAFHNGMNFTTKDQDNDLWSSNCAYYCQGAWWFHSCHYSNLNGLFRKPGPTPGRRDGVVWLHWKNTSSYSLAFSEMKMRPRRSP